MKNLINTIYQGIYFMGKITRMGSDQAQYVESILIPKED
jgi:hypothetical protein